jgi:PAS domain-containing protein
MYASVAEVESMLEVAVKAAGGRDDNLTDMLNSLDAPIYVTDPDGVITHFSRACVEFAGRTPATGKDRWCVTWKLYTNDGEFLPHDQCPMAIAIRQSKPIRGVTAIAERPDGTRVNFMPFPTPLLDAGGAMVGAINVLIDITEVGQISELKRQARRCRELARAINDPGVANTLDRMACEYDAKAASLSGDPKP